MTHPSSENTNLTQPKPSLYPSTEEMVESAASTVKDTAGAVRNLALSLLQAVSPPAGVSGPKGKDAGLERGRESPQFLQNIKVLRTD